jgi:hypothetical protein
MADVVHRTDHPKAIVPSNPHRPQKRAERSSAHGDGRVAWCSPSWPSPRSPASAPTDGIDEGLSRLALAVGTEPLDLPASIFNIVGQIGVTALIAVILSFVWWRRRGARGLVPMLLFAGCGNRGDPEARRPASRPAGGAFAEHTLLPLRPSSSPYSFPSGHMLRVTFPALP